MHLFLIQSDQQAKLKLISFPFIHLKKTETLEFSICRRNRSGPQRTYLAGETVAVHELVGLRHMHQAQSHLWLPFKTEAGVLQKAPGNALYGEEPARSSTESG